jgi:hypothetical protein
LSGLLPEDVVAVEDSVPPPGPSIELAVLDAPVLARGGVTEFLLRLVDAGAFDPVWSDQIHGDWMQGLARAHPNIPAERLRARRVSLDRAFPAANIAVSRDALDEVLAHCTSVSERKSAHILATALSARAAVIVSIGMFRPRAVLKKLWHGTEVVSPDQWCVDLLENRTESVLAGARAHWMARGESPAVWLSRLADPAIGLPRIAARLALPRHVEAGGWS